MTPDLPLLLDTHVWLWLANSGPACIRPSTVRAIESAGARHALRISVISIWEVAMLESKGRLELPMGVAEWIRRALDRADFEVLGLEPEIAIESRSLPGAFHGDPADRFLIATARLRRLIIVTRDARMLKYAQQGHVHAMAA
jgi:PIN domain nuclease of toxin-antitoxin system